jgi:hypothetical protein
MYILQEILLSFEELQKIESKERMGTVVKVFSARHHAPSISTLLPLLKID